MTRTLAHHSAKREGGTGTTRMTRMKSLLAATAALFVAAAAFIVAQGPRTHRLEARPDTVAYGYYWSEAKPVLRIASGDIIDVDTLLTSTPASLTRA